MNVTKNPLRYCIIDVYLRHRQRNGADEMIKAATTDGVLVTVGPHGKQYRVWFKTLGNVDRVVHLSAIGSVPVPRRSETYRHAVNAARAKLVKAQATT
jgi:hypothetical protein